MDIRKVKKLIELLEESGISEIEISEGEESVRISRYPQGGGGFAYMPPPQPPRISRRPRPASSIPAPRGPPAGFFNASRLNACRRDRS